MSRPRSVFDRLKEKGEEVLSQISNEVVNSPYFAKAMQGAMKGKEKLDEAVGETLKRLNIPTRSEFRRATDRIEALERELADVRAASATQPAPPARAASKPRARRPRRRAPKTPSSSE